MNKRAIFALWTVCAWLSLGLAQGQDAALMLGLPDEGLLEPGQVRAYTFTALAGSIVSFSAVGTDGRLDPVLTLLNVQGQELVRNDDIALQRGTEAMIEAFVLPASGSYRLLLSGFGNSSGPYLLKSQYGYLNVAQTDNFGGAAAWSVQAYSSSTPRATNQEGALNLALGGAQARAVAWATPTTLRDFYGGVLVRNISTRYPWSVGLALRTEGRTLVITLGSRGAWRALSLSEDGALDVLRDWSVHPSIVAGANSFRLEVLAYQGALDVFYDRQYVGTLNGAFRGSVDRLGAYAETASDPASSLTVQFDEYLVTIPTLVNGARLPLERLTWGRSESVVRNLQRAGAAPIGGALAFNVPETQIQRAVAGVGLAALVANQTYGDFAMGATVRQSSGGGLTGCGLAVRVNDERSYALAYADSVGGIGWSLRRGDDFLQNLFLETTPSETSTLLIVALGGQAVLYVNGVRRGQLVDLPLRGGVSVAVANYDGLSATCVFRDVWLWAW
ncbi:MAG: hypothetical protein NZ750_03985 [Anaerolineae bacterium]|nr:hypothetical protein [Anaerolineae bacterium]MDW8171482.1 hypothetical protein [Anaerolineae bacterium]